MSLRIDSTEDEDEEEEEEEPIRGSELIVR